MLKVTEDPKVTRGLKVLKDLWVLKVTRDPKVMQGLKVLKVP